MLRIYKKSLKYSFKEEQYIHLASQSIASRVIEVMLENTNKLHALLVITQVVSQT